MKKSGRDKAKERATTRRSKNQSSREPSADVTASHSKSYRWLKGGMLLLALAGVWYFLSVSMAENSKEKRSLTQRTTLDSRLSSLTADELAGILKLPVPRIAGKGESRDVDALMARLDTALSTLATEMIDDAQAEHLQGLIHLRCKRTKIAEPHLRRAVQLAPNNLDMRGDLADLLSQLGYDEEALAMLRASIKAAPTAGYWEKLGDCQMRLGNLEDAANSFEAAIKSTPGNAELWIKLAKLQLQHQKWTESESSVRKAIEIDSNRPEPWSLLGRALSVLKRTEEAKAALARARELSDQNDDPKADFEVAHALSTAKLVGSSLRSMAILYQDKGHLDKAMALYRHALQADPEDWLAMGKLAALMRRSGEFELALNIHRQLVSEQPREAAHYQNLANLCMELNRPGDAEAALRLACLRLPGNQQMQELLKNFLMLVGKSQ